MTRPGLLEWPPPLALVFLGAIGALFTRRVVIRRRGGTFDCSLRLTPGSARAAVHLGASSPLAGAPAAEPDNFRASERGTRMPLSASGVRAGRGWAYGIAQYENDR